MSETMGPVFILIAAFIGLTFALKYKREETLNMMSEEAGKVLREELRSRTRRTAVRWIGGTLTTLGLGLAFGPSALQYTMDMKVKTSTTWYNHIFKGIFTGSTSDEIALGDAVSAGVGDATSDGVSMGDAASYASTANLAFASDWATQTGTDSAAILDGSTWSGILGVAGPTAANKRNNVVDSATAGVGFPTTNVFQIRYWDTSGLDSAAMVHTGQAGDPTPIPQVGEYLFLRHYYYNDLTPGSSVSVYHYYHVGRVSGVGKYLMIWDNSGAPGVSDSLYQERVQLNNQNNSMGLGGGVFITDTQTKAFVLEVRELRIERTDADSVRVNIRVTDASGSLLRSGIDYYCNISQAGGCKDNGTGNPAGDSIGQFKFGFSEADTTNLFKGRELGNNGPQSQPSGDTIFLYVGAYATRVSTNANDWIGLFPAVGEGNYDPPNTPTATAVMFLDTAGYANGSAFVGSSDDSIQYAIYEFDSLRGNFTTDPVLVDTQTAAAHPLRSDTVLNFTAADTFKVRMKHVGHEGGASSYSTVDTFVAASTATLDWFCDWDFAVDSTSAATRGTASTGSGLTECFGAESVFPDTAMLETIANPGNLGFPASMTNLLKMKIARPPALHRSQQLEAFGIVDTIPIGGAMFLRSYDRLDLGVGQSTNTHVMHVGNKNLSPDYVYWHVQSNSTVRSDSTYDMDAEIRVGTASKWRDKNATAGPAFEVIRREVRFYRPHADTLVVNVQTFDSTGSALAVPPDYWCQVCGGTFHVDLLADQRFYMSNPSYWDAMTHLELGNNGADAADPATVQLWYWGGVAIRVTTDTAAWIGAYPVAGTGEVKPTFLFSSDWSTGTGTGTAALRDSAKATAWSTSSSGLEVVAVADSSLDFPTTNALLVANTGFNALRLNSSSGAIPAVGVGDSIFVRFYRRSFINGNNSHGEYWDDGAGGVNWGPAIAGFYEVNASGSAYESYCSSAQFPAHGAGRYYGHDLTAGVSYRHEMRIVRTDSTTHTIGCRIYDISDVLLFDSDASDFPVTGGSALLKDQTFTATSTASYATLEGFIVGTEAVNGTADPTKYLAGFAICSVTWCGAYPGVGEGN